MKIFGEMIAMEIKVKITEMRKNKGKIIFDENKLTSNISQTDIDIIVTNAIELFTAQGGNDE